MTRLKEIVDNLLSINQKGYVEIEKKNIAFLEEIKNRTILDMQEHKKLMAIMDKSFKDIQDAVL